MNYELDAYDVENFSKCWQYNDQVRNAKLDKERNEIYEEAENKYCDRIRAECKQLWAHSSSPVSMMVKPTPLKKCYNHNCYNEVNWQWATVKNFCAGDRCVEQLLPDATHKMKMNCIRMELKRYWENFELELSNATSSQIETVASTSPSSVQYIDSDQVDFDESDLYCDETLIFELEDLECDSVLQNERR
jgi:hypothetical protein